MALKYPSWQDSIIETVRNNFNNMTLDIGAISKAIPKAETKRAMPFVQTLKKSLETGIDASTVFERKLAFDEQQVLTDMVPNLKQTVQKCAVVEVVVVNEGGKTGKVVGGTEGVTVWVRRGLSFLRARSLLFPGSRRSSSRTCRRRFADRFFSRAACWE
jgi:leucyl-tRNA synthetase